MAKDGSSSSSSSSSSGSDSGSASSTSGSSSSSSSPSSRGGTPPPKPAPAARAVKSSERDAKDASRVVRSPTRSPRAVKRKRESPVRPSRYRDESPPRRRRSPSARDHRDRESDDRRRGGRGADIRDSRRYDDRRRRGSPDGRRADRDDNRRSGRGEQNGGRELPPPPPFSGDKDRHGKGGRDRRSGFGEGPPEGQGDMPPAPGPPANGSAPPIEGKIHRSRANRWEPQDNQALPGPPGPPPQREDRDWNHQTKEEAFLEEDKPPPEANFALSGKLAEESNTVNGVVLLHTEPPEARRTLIRWRLYTFKNGDMFGEPIPIHKQTCYFFGRERRVADIPTDHPSCSKQHAILQYRLTDKEEEGITKSEVRPYIMDLGSTNGTYLNNERLDSERYYELLPKDLIKFGNSSREYVLLHERALEEG